MAKPVKQDGLFELEDYLVSSELKIDDLEDQSKDLVEDAFHRDKDMKRITSSLKNDMDHLKSKLEDIKISMDVFKKEIKRIVDDFKFLGKKEQFKRVQDKVDEWAPETFVTKDEVLRNL